MAEQKQQMSIAPNKFAELLLTELSFIAQLENFIAWLTALREKVELPEKLSTKLFLNELILAYQPVIEVLKESSIYSMAMAEKNEITPQDKKLPLVSDDFKNVFTNNLTTLKENLLDNGEFEILSHALVLLSNNQGYFRQKLSSFNANEIDDIYNKLTQKPSNFSVEEVKTELASCLSKPTSRVAQYPLLLREFFDKDSAESKNLEKITTQSNKTVTPLAHKTQALSQRHLLDTPTKPQAGGQLATKITSLRIEKRRTQKQAKKKIEAVLKSLTDWEQQQKNSLLKIEFFSLRKIVQQLRKRLYKNFYLLNTRGLESIHDVISSAIILIERKRPGSSLIGALKETRNNSIVISDKAGNDQNISASIHLPLLDEVFKVIGQYLPYHSGELWTKETKLERNAFKNISTDLENLKSNINNQKKPYKPEHGNLWIDIVKIFQRHCHIAGHFPKHFHNGEFGKMLRSLSKALDAYKPEKYHSAFTLISAPEDYHYTQLAPGTKLPPALQSAVITPARLCFNICRIVDYYCNTNLGKIVAENIQDPHEKTNKNHGWEKEILELDVTINKILRTSSNDEQTLKQMVDAIKDTISTIQKGWGSKNSRTLGTLKKLVSLYDTAKSSSSDEDDNTLPEGVVVSTEGYTDEMVLNYINKHITEHSSRSLIKYLETDYSRSFLNPTAVAKIDDTIEILNRLNNAYRDSAANAPSLETSKKQEAHKLPGIAPQETYSTPLKPRSTTSKRPANTPLSPICEQKTDNDLSPIENNDNAGAQPSTDNVATTFFWQRENHFSTKTSASKTYSFGEAIVQTEDYLTSIGISCNN